MALSMALASRWQVSRTCRDSTLTHGPFGPGHPSDGTADGLLPRLAAYSVFSASSWLNAVLQSPTQFEDLIVFVARYLSQKFILYLSECFLISNQPFAGVSPWQHRYRFFDTV